MQRMRNDAHPRSPSGPSLAAGLLIALFACTHPVVHPGELGDCISTRDAAACPSPAPGSGAGAVGGVGSSGGGVDSGSGGTASCGAAEAAFSAVTANTQCVPCIQTNCCMAEMACDTGCTALVACALGCSLGNTSCLVNCENNALGTSFSAYGDLSSCVNTACVPEGCPTLQPLP